MTTNSPSGNGGRPEYGPSSSQGAMPQTERVMPQQREPQRARRGQDATVATSPSRPQPETLPPVAPHRAQRSERAQTQPDTLPSPTVAAASTEPTNPLTSPWNRRDWGIVPNERPLPEEGEKGSQKLPSQRLPTETLDVIDGAGPRRQIDVLPTNSILTRLNSAPPRDLLPDEPTPPERSPIIDFKTFANGTPALGEVTRLAQPNRIDLRAETDGTITDLVVDGHYIGNSSVVVGHDTENNPVYTFVTGITERPPQQNPAGFRTIHGAQFSEKGGYERMDYPYSPEQEQRDLTHWRSAWEYASRQDPTGTTGTTGEYQRVRDRYQQHLNRITRLTNYEIADDMAQRMEATD